MESALLNIVLYNELGSRMTITEMFDGQMRGTYETAVGDAQYEYVAMTPPDTP